MHRGGEIKQKKVQSVQRNCHRQPKGSLSPGRSSGPLTYTGLAFVLR